MWSEESDDSTFSDTSLLDESITAGTRAAYTVTFKHSGTLPAAERWFVLLWDADVDLPGDGTAESEVSAHVQPTLTEVADTVEASFTVEPTNAGEYTVIVGYGPEDEQNGPEGKFATFGTITAT